MMLHPLVLGLIGAALLLLAGATLLGQMLRRRTVGVAGAIPGAAPGASDRADTIRNLNARIRSWWLMVAVLGAAVLLGRGATVTLFAVLSFLALREFVTLTPSRPGDHRSLFLSFFLVVPAQYVLIGIGWYGLFSILIPVYVFLALPALSAVAGDTHDFLARSAKVQWGLMLAVYAISHAPALLTLNIEGYRYPGVVLLIYLVVVAQLSDVFQYVCGKLFGRHRLAPKVSPSKTVEGLLGGGLAAVLVGTALYPITPFTPLAAAGMSLAIVAAGFLGGFVLSAVKRDLGAKDWGAMIEGHGGVLDRLDSLAFAAPIFFHLTRYWYTA